jgi:hypothetical protein
VRALVEVYQAFAAIPADDAVPADQDGDGTLAQFGPWAAALWSSRPASHGSALVPVTRMWQLSCTLYWDPSPETDAVASGYLWSFGMSLTAFFSQAVALPGWAWALNGSQRPQDLEVELNQV